MLLIQEDDMKKLENEFNRIDKNKDGHLSLQELKKEYGVNLMDGQQDGDFETIFQNLDENQDNLIGFNEFIQAASNIVTKSNVARLFNLIDIDGSGTLSLKELKTIFQPGNKQESKELIDQFQANDTDNSGQLDLEEFNAAMKGFFE